MATKKDKVDFIYNVAKYNGLKYTKTSLNRMPVEALGKFINQSSEVKEKFELYLEHISSNKNAKSADGSIKRRRKVEILDVSDEKIELLNEIVGDLVDSPTSFLAIMKMNDFMGNLKYGEIPDNILKINIDILKTVSPVWAFKLLDFSVSQTLVLQDEETT